MSEDKEQLILEGAKPQVEIIRGVTPQTQNDDKTHMQGGVQPQHLGETGEGGGPKPPASK